MVSATTTVKKTSAPKKLRSHPPYVEMISEAITTLKERTGSSQVAIAKFIEEKQKDLPPNFRKLLSVQLKKLAASGKLTKIKSSFKVSPVVKPVAAAKPKKAPATKKKSSSSSSTAAAGAAKAKPVTQKKKAVVKKPAAAAKKPVTAPAKAKKTPVKKAAVAKVKKTPAKKVVKKPKTIKTPAKKPKK